MKSLPPPTDQNEDPFVAGEVFDTCVSMVRKRELKEQLQAIRRDVETEAEDYEVKATEKQLYRKQPHDQVGTVLGIEIVKVYTLRMVPKKSKGRPIYDRIMAAPLHRRCPMCGIGTVNTLDHYLPKTHFPVFSVTPKNLIPACEWCQGEKSEYYATAEGDQLLHPYFDNVENHVWLAAEVIVGAPAGFRYFASPPEDWTPSEKERVAAHLRELKLPLLFSLNAGSRLSEIRARLANLHQKGGEEAVRAYLQEELSSLEADNLNSWVAAMYRATLASNWFCDGGFFET